jgi:hypothetical protein
MKISKTTLSTFLATAILGLSFSAGTSIYATTYDTVPSWDGSSTIQPWGPFGTQTYGETVVVPTGATRLFDFTFYIKAPTGTSITAQGEVYNWSGNMHGGNPPQGVSGAALYTGSSFLYAGNDAFQAITVSIAGGLVVTPGEHIVMDLMSLVGNGNAQWGDILFQHVANDGGGGFNFNNGPSSSAIWDDFADFGDLAFIADFNGEQSVPDAGSTVVLLGVAIMVVGLVHRRLTAKRA